ncbi:hypothetical protein [Promicromonospora sukumoe]|uniref:hypothetical protein n=1 Tax=Promicromonospora sukumoe TaxID=88382 RepID=UPI000360A5B0|nr:hypothetical protein [Promicromonospora sukumoe]
MTVLQLTSPSAATDGAWLAAADVAAISASLGVEYRLIGGIATTLLTHVHDVADRVPARETADADMGVSTSVCANPRLPGALAGLGYTREDGSRFAREDPGARRVIDVLVPSYLGKHQPNQELGALVVDAVPGLSLALALPATEVMLRAHLSNGSAVELSLSLPDVRAALVLKAYAYRERLTTRDAVDVWRLLESAESAGLQAGDWPVRASGRDAAAYLHQFFGAAGAPGARRASPSPATQARVRVLVQKLIPRPA